MATASYTLKSAKVTSSHDGSSVVEVLWKADFRDSDGVAHVWDEWFVLTPTSEHSPTAAAMLAKATTSEAILAAIHADAARALAELEDPNHPAGSRPYVTPDHVIPVAIDFDESGQVTKVTTAQEEAAARIAAALANAQHVSEN